MADEMNGLIRQGLTETPVDRHSRLAARLFGEPEQAEGETSSTEGDEVA